MKKCKHIQIILLFIAIVGIIDTIIMASRSGNVDTGIMLPSIGGASIIFVIIFIKTERYKKNNYK